MKVGINGFGRIGRCVTRHIIEDRPDIEIVKINASDDDGDGGGDGDDWTLRCLYILRC